MIGPNTKRLITRKMALIAIPVGSGKDAFGIGLNALMSPTSIAKQAADWVQAAIAVMKTAPDNPYKTDEEIAAAILKGIDASERGER